MSYLRCSGDDSLYCKSSDVADGEDVSGLIDMMWKVMGDNGGIGLAANQVGSKKRVIVVAVPNGITQEIINPKITKRSGKMVRSIEGCLSFPGEKVTVMRDKRITVEGLNRNGERVLKKCRGLDAFCIQHEIDHLNGKNIK